MLKKKERLTKKEFDRSFSSGRRYHSPVLTLIHEPGDNFHGAVVVGKKVYKKAVDRNRLRRRLYNVLYRLSRANELTGTHILLTKPTAKDLSFAQLKEEVEGLLNKIK